MPELIFDRSIRNASTSVIILKRIQDVFSKIIKWDRWTVLCEALRGCVGRSILDVGSGAFSPEIRELRGRLGNSFRAIAVDLSPSSLSQGRRLLPIYDEYVVADGRRLPFKDRSFDAVFCFETIEHLPKEDGYSLLDELDRLAKKLLVISTPTGFMPARNHRSGWKPGQLRAKGYETRGVIGPFFLRENRKLGKLGKYLAHPTMWLTYLLAPIFYVKTERAYQFIGWKRVQNSSNGEGL